MTGSKVCDNCDSPATVDLLDGETFSIICLHLCFACSRDMAPELLRPISEDPPLTEE